MRMNSRFGFVMFDKHSSSLAAVNRFDGVWFLNHRLRVSLAHSNLFQGAKRWWPLGQFEGNIAEQGQEVTGV
ncbi:hypothetical protein U1Q18_014404 [Sarracenia purpurea var. burkii]